MTVRELLMRIDSSELTEWQSFFLLKQLYEAEARGDADAMAKARQALGW